MVEDEEERQAAQLISGNVLWKMFNLTSFVALHQGAHTLEFTYSALMKMTDSIYCAL